MDKKTCNYIIIAISIISFVSLIWALGVMVWNDLSKHPPVIVDVRSEVVEVVEPVLTRADNEYFAGKKLVAFTFDDGPNFKVTERLLDEAAKRDAKLTFFMVGNRLERQADLVKRVFDEGHTVGNHSFSHKNLNKLSVENYLYEIDHTNQLLKNITGQDVVFLRPPYGNYTKNILANVNMSFILWNVDTLDWKSRNAQMVYEEAIKDIEDGDVVLFHDLYETSVDGAIMAMDYLIEQGFAFVSLDEMYRLRGMTIEKNKAVRHFNLPDPEPQPETVVPETAIPENNIE